MAVVVHLAHLLVQTFDQIIGLLCVVSLCSGPQPGWDPDIVAALEAAETSNTLEDELEDDFVTMVRLVLLPST